MSNTIIELSGVTLRGKRYDLVRLIEAGEFIVDGLIRRFGQGLARVSVFGERGQTQLWPAPGKYYARVKWLEWSRTFDACDLAVVYSFGPMSVVAYLLGTESFAADFTVGAIRSQSGRYGDGIDPAPGLCVYGANLGNGRFDLLSPALAQEVDRLFDGQFGPFGARHGVREAGGGSGRVVVAVFRHDQAFGRGESDLRVRCLADLRQIKLKFSV